MSDEVTCPTCGGTGRVKATVLVRQLVRDLEELRDEGLLEVFRIQNKDLIQRLLHHLREPRMCDLTHYIGVRCRNPECLWNRPPVDPT